MYRKSKHKYTVCLGQTSLVPYTHEDIDEIISWCIENFGPSGRNRRWRHGWIIREKDTFYFRNEKDALWFELRWS